ncbi:unnamed protein product [Cylindrotheca closterium]|uniref:Uncharacterized protein n=1 Tax=Cylindrotheca closterium TaxID=2856 RepID=A0AAD2JJV5_9STRA|nr:unnamed protein product [Cylindrotheca closterium]
MLITMTTKHFHLFTLVGLLTFHNILGAPIERMLQGNETNFPQRRNATAASTSTTLPHIDPTTAPTESPAPSPAPSAIPTDIPTAKPSSTPTKTPTVPSDSPTESPAPSPSPSKMPTMLPTRTPTASPSASPSASKNPSTAPSTKPTFQPTAAPTRSQQPSSNMQPYSASGVEIVLENVVEMPSMNEKDISLFESTTKQILQNDFSSPGINEILFLKVELKEQKMMPTRRKLRKLQHHQNADLAISFDVTALVNHEWNIPFDLNEGMVKYFGTDEKLEKLRSQLEAEGASFLDKLGSTSDGTGSISTAAIIGALAGLLAIIIGIAVAYRQRSAKFQSKLSLASTGSDEDEDESSDTQMIFAGQNTYGGNILSWPTPTGENEGVEADYFGSSRPAFLTMDSNIEVPDTPVGHTPQKSKPGVSALDTPNSIFGPQNNSTRSVGARQFLMDTPPSAMNGNNTSSRGFWPPRSGGQRNVTPKKQTIDMSPARLDTSKAEGHKVESSPIKFPSDSNSKIDQKHKLTPPTRDTQRSTSKLRQRRWPSGYFSDESSP